MKHNRLISIIFAILLMATAAAATPSPAAATPTTAQPATGTTISREHNAPRHGDNSDITSAGASDAGERGPECVWNIPIQEGSNHSRRFIEHNDTLIALDSPCYMSFNNFGDTLMLSSFETRELRINYNRKVPVMKYPMNYGDSVSCITSGQGIYGKRLNVIRRGFASVVADGLGILTDGVDTLRNVLRVHLRHNYKQIISADSITIEAFHELEDITSPNQPDYTEDCYLWFAAGCRYPVMERHSLTTVIGQEPTITDVKTYVYTPHDQISDLREDSANRILVAQLSAHNAQNSLSTDDPADTYISNVDALLDSDGQGVSINFTATSPTYMRMGLFDSLGRCLALLERESVNPGSYTESMRLSSQPVGTLLLSVFSNDSTHIYKVRHE